LSDRFRLVLRPQGVVGVPVSSKEGTARELKSSSSLGTEHTHKGVVLDTRAPVVAAVGLVRGRGMPTLPVGAEMIEEGEAGINLLYASLVKSPGERVSASVCR